MTRKLIPSWLKHSLYGVTGFMVVAFGLIGFAHTPTGRPMLHWLANSAGCPIDFDADPAKVEAFRVQRLRSNAGKLAATTHPALGFQLGRSARSEVQTWLTAHAATCETVRRGSVIQCGPIADLAGLPVRALHLQFDAEDRLVAVDVQRGDVQSHAAVAHLQRLKRSLESDVGAVTTQIGELDASYLNKQRFARSSLEFRYQDYLAQISATHLDATGISLREQYQWTPPTG